MMTLRQLRAFAEVYRLRNITHAAEAMRITQSAMSVLIRQMEEALGVPLFERTPRALRPTAAADEAYGRVVRILEDIDSLQDRLRAKGSSARRQLAFTCTPALAATVIPPAMAEFRQRMPDAKVTIHDAADATLIDDVLAEKVEFSIGFFESDPEALELEPLATDCLLAVCRGDAPLASRPKVTWADLSGHSIIKLSKGTPLQRQIGDALSANGFAYEPDYEVTFLHTALAMIGEGLGIAILPGYLFRGNPHTAGLVGLKLHDPIVERRLLVHTRPGHTLSEPASLFLSLLRARLQRT